MNININKIIIIINDIYNIKSISFYIKIFKKNAFILKKKKP